MIIISDSSNYLLEKVANSKGINEVIFKNFYSEINEEEIEKADFVLILLSDSHILSVRLK